MSTKKELIDMCGRILWIEKQMKESYSIYSSMLKDDEMVSALKEIESDEVRHINMAERILSILSK